MTQEEMDRQLGECIREQRASYELHAVLDYKLHTYSKNLRAISDMIDTYPDLTPSDIGELLGHIDLDNLLDTLVERSSAKSEAGRLLKVVTSLGGRLSEVA